MLDWPERTKTSTCVLSGSGFGSGLALLQATKDVATKALKNKNLFCNFIITSPILFEQKHYTLHIYK
jgi:hypothetical protein